MVPLGLSAIALAHALGVTPARINDLVGERRGIEKPHPLNVGFFVGPPHLRLRMGMACVPTPDSYLRSHLSGPILPGASHPSHFGPGSSRGSHDFPSYHGSGGCLSASRADMVSDLLCDHASHPRSLQRSESIYGRR